MIFFNRLLYFENITPLFGVWGYNYRQDQFDLSIKSIKLNIIKKLTQNVVVIKNIKVEISEIMIENHRLTASLQIEMLIRLLRLSILAWINTKDSVEFSFVWI